MSDPQRDRTDRAMLDLAARLASRAAGLVEPNPMVGCVIGRRGDTGVEILGMGHHRVFGGAHAEAEALRAAAGCAGSIRGATVWVTLEPCAHDGKTPPCAEALREAGVGEVVIARSDPHPQAMGGAALLRAAGVKVRFTDVSPAAQTLTDPFVKRIAEGLPWVIGKWAQTIDGRIATRSGASKWISNERSRLDVHRLRSRVDAILSGIGTVKADDPMLTARTRRRPRRIAQRVVIDPFLELPERSALVSSADEAPVLVFCGESADAAHRKKRDRLHGVGVEVVEVPMEHGGMDLRTCLRRLAMERDATNVLVEAGPGLLSSMLDQGLFDELRVYIAPVALADDAALPALRGRIAPELADGTCFSLERVRRFGDDVLVRWRRPAPQRDAF